MTMMKQALQIDAMPVTGFATARPRPGNGRQAENLPDMFPDVLASLALPNELPGEAALGESLRDANVKGDGGTGAEDANRDDVTQRKQPQADLPADVKRYFQDFAVRESAPREAKPQDGDPIVDMSLEAPVPQPEKLPDWEVQTPRLSVQIDKADRGELKSDLIPVEQVPQLVQQPVQVAQPRGQMTDVTQDIHILVEADVKKTEIGDLARPRESKVAVLAALSVEPGQHKEIPENNSRDALMLAALSVEPGQHKEIPENSSRDAPMKFSDAMLRSENNRNAPVKLSDAMSPSDAVKFPEVKAANAVETGNGKPASDLASAGSQILQLPTEKLLETPARPRIKAAEPELRVIKVETSFSPVASSQFATQFAQAIADTLSTLLPNPAALVASPVSDLRREVVKSIQIQLHPEVLGEVKVAMHLRGDELMVKVKVTTREAEALLLNDRQTLKDLLGQAGYDLNDASISISLSPTDLGPSQRSITANGSSQEPQFGQGSRQHPGASEENQSRFQNERSSHAYASEFDEDGNSKTPAPDPVRVGRGNGVFV